MCLCLCLCLCLCVCVCFCVCVACVRASFVPVSTRRSQSESLLAEEDDVGKAANFAMGCCCTLLFVG